jgi:hypothetical protein
MMDTKGKLMTVIIALTILGCKGTITSSAAGTVGGEGTAADGTATSASTTGTTGTRVETIPDTTMDNKTAFYVTVPANWKFQGILLQGGLATCESYTFAVFRATSADGQSFAEAMPEQLWAYGDGPKPRTGCLPLNGPISAQEFLKYLSTTMQVAYVSDAPLPEPLAQQVKSEQARWDTPAPFYAQNHLAAPKVHLDGASAYVSYKNGTISMKGRLVAFLKCQETPHPGMRSTLRGMADSPTTVSGKCTADVSYVAAPEGQFASVERLWETPDWARARTRNGATHG